MFSVGERPKGAFFFAKMRIEMGWFQVQKLNLEPHAQLAAAVLYKSAWDAKKGWWDARQFLYSSLCEIICDGLGINYERFIYKWEMRYER
jgi:hypothetical protein